MADITYDNLPVDVVAGDDIFCVQKAGGGINYQTTLSSIQTINRHLAEAHSASDQLHSAITTSPTPLEGYTNSLTSVGVTTTLIPTGASNRATFTANVDAYYRVTFNIDVLSPATGENVDFVLNIDGTPTPFKASVDLSNAAIDHGTASINTFIEVLTGQVVEMYANSDGTTFNDLTVDSLTFTIKKE